MTRRQHSPFPISLWEFACCTVGTALTVYAVGCVLGFQFFT